MSKRANTNTAEPTGSARRPARSRKADAGAADRPAPRARKAKPAAGTRTRRASGRGSTTVTIEIGWDADQFAALSRVLKVDDFDALLFHYFRQSVMWSCPVGSAVELLKVDVK